jgi:hypothetical protein
MAKVTMDGILIGLLYRSLPMQVRIMVIIQCGKSGKSELDSLWQVLFLTNLQQDV